jgi:hypothetical protein
MITAGKLVKEANIFILLLIACPLQAQENVLESSVRVNADTGASSGVIIAQKPNGNNTTILVLSTGHMMNRTNPQIEIFYLKGRKLEKPIIINGNILLLIENNFKKGTDFCIIRAEVESKGISHTPLAPAGFSLKKGDKLLSVGCDLGEVPKCHDLTMTKYNEKRSDFDADGWSKVGRSGGGVFTNDGKYVVGVCWGGYADAPKTMCTSHKIIVLLMEQCEINCD